MRDINEFINRAEKYMIISIKNKKFRNELSKLKEKVKYTPDEAMMFRWEELGNIIMKCGDEKLFRYVFL